MRMRLLCLLIVGTLSAFSVEAEGQWVYRDSGTNSDFTDVVMLDSTTAYVVSRGRSILRTTDRGETWFDLTAPLSYVMPWNGLTFYDPENGVAVGDYGTVFTIKGGDMSGWCRAITESPVNLHSALYVTPAEIFVGADSGWIFHSLDSGRTWSSEKISQWPIRSIFEMRGVYFVGLPLFALTSHSICTKLEISSSPWSETILEAFQSQGAEAFDGEFACGDGPAYIVGFGGDADPSPVILRRSPSDTSWNKVQCGNINNGPLLGVSAPSANVVYACGRAGMTIRSTDGGSSWSQYQVPVTAVAIPDLNAIHFIDEEHGTAAGAMGTILYTSNGGLTHVSDGRLGIPGSFILEQNYPNPFNPSTVIRFVVRNSGYVSLKIYDVLGREIVTLIDGERKSPGGYSVRWDGRDRNGMQAASGIYFYELATQTGRQVKKAVMVR